MAPIQHDRISIDPAVCHGKPVIRGTRVLVSVVVGAVAGGDAQAKVAQAFAISEDDVRAAIAYANDILSRERHYPLAS